MSEEVSALDRMSIRFQATEIDTVLKIIRFLNGLMAVGLGVLYPLSFALSDMAVTPQKVLLCCYSIAFALMLAIFELRIDNARMHWMFQNMCGFMYSFTGRLLFLLFISSLALAGQSQWCYLVGGLGVTLSCANGFVVCNHPHFAAKDEAEQKEEEVRRYIEEHPEVLQQAMEAHGVHTQVGQQRAPDRQTAGSRGKSTAGTFDSVSVPVQDDYMPPSMADGFVGGGGSHGGAGPTDAFAAEGGSLPSTLGDGFGADQDELPEDNPFA
jgi:hypothetical protein